MPRIELVTGPTSEPVTVDDIRAHLRQSTEITVDATYVTALIKACRAAIEEYADIRLLNQTWRIWYDDDEIDSKLDIPLYPLSSVTSIAVYDEAGAATTATASDYYVSPYGRSPFVALYTDNTWPEVDSQRDYNALCITAVFGFGATDTAVSEPEYYLAEHALKMWLYYIFANRGNADTSQMSYGTSDSVIPPEIRAMLDPIRPRRLM